MKILKRHSYIIIILLFTINLLFAQDDPLTFNEDDEGNVIYTDVIKIDGKSGLELYNRSKDWFVENYNSANDVIQLDDKDRLKITGKGFFNEVIKVGMAKLDLDVYHTISIQAKDGRYKYEISQIYWKWNSTTVSKCQKTNFTLNSERIKICMNKKQFYAMKSHIDMRMKDIIKNLNNDMSEKKKVEEDW
ncbi:DUF4468 domain-containing protein [Lutimonas saemankumensis]|uniref:DUF4468 domain-containing protein n=1 Tax=Lutimonas saemankumensis TaxID=483016 RepID=UPI001CD34539|nr:DUF4468 domain-containing protein [Lutimonas saemankumensis]MCA0933095.1 DUF4468 domain-containing protein [Lutimonas saemankumensis]